MAKWMRRLNRASRAELESGHQIEKRSALLVGIDLATNLAVCEIHSGRPLAEHDVERHDDDAGVEHNGKQQQR